MLKHSKEIQKNLDQVKRYSPEFTLQKFNNYDNSAKQQTRLGFETKARFHTEAKEKSGFDSKADSVERSIHQFLTSEETDRKYLTANKLEIKKAQQ